MKVLEILAAFEEKHPWQTAFCGVGGGGVSLWLNHLEEVQRIFAFVGTVAGAGVAVLTLLIKWRTWRARNAPFKRPADVDDIPF